MTSTAQKWLIGCGIGCAAVVVMIALGIGGGIWLVRDLKGRFDTAEQKAAELNARFGEVEDWAPPADGAVPAPRLEIFLAVRDSLAGPQARFVETFESFERVSEQGGDKSLLAILHAVRGGMSIAPLLGEFLNRRNSALASLGMGMGEYTYIYALGYYAFLGKTPDAQPANVRYRDSVDDHEIRSKLHGQLLALLRNQLAEVDRTGAGRSGAWRETLAAEIQALEQDRSRLAWRDGLPPAIAASFAPYRDRLEGTWSEAGNAFALAGAQGDGRNIQIGD